MKYKNFKDIKLSQLGMGIMRLPVFHNDPQQINYDLSQEMIDYAMENGINYYDTAYIYHDGESEVFLGKALKKYPRESYYIADKFNISAEPNYQLQFQNQLKKLDTDYIDFYLLHGVGDNNIDQFLKSGCIDYFLELKKQGKIKYLGFSFHGRVQYLQQIVDLMDWDFCQIQLNYYDWYHGSAKEQYQILADKHIPVMVMEPVHGGMLANLSDKAGAPFHKLNQSLSYASYALRFVWDLEYVCVVLSGMSHIDQISENMKLASHHIPLKDKEKDAIQQVSDILYKEVGVPCTACRYCVNHCPKGLDIPFLLQMYNEYKIGGQWRLSRLEALDEQKKPSACISCGLCTKQCPQNIEVKTFMKDLVDHM